jgi:Reverse transcriptase (RNA-dependent DNA polymerase)
VWRDVGERSEDGTGNRVGGVKIWVSPDKQQFLNNHPFLPTQYVYYVPSPSPQSFAPKTLPSVAHIPILTSKVDFFPWDEAVTSLLRANGIIGHILDPLEPVDPSRPDQIPISMPVLPATPTQADLADLSRWWDTDNTAQHILTSRIGSVPRGLLPSPNIATRTALSIYQTLTRYYGNSSFADSAELLNSLHQMICQPGRIQEYVSKWRTGVSRLQSSKFPFSIKLSISQFVRGLPFIPAFNTLHASLPSLIATAHDQDYGTFVTITENALELDTIFRSTTQSSHIPRQASFHPHVPAPVVPPASSTPTVTTSAPNIGSGTTKICSNCGRHITTTCFSPGGGMEGQRDVYKKDKSKVVAMLIASLDDAFSLSDEESLPPVLDDPSPTLDDIHMILHTTSFSTSSSSVHDHNQNIDRDLYPMRDTSKPSAFVSVPQIDPTSFLSLGGRFNACLDSGCTDHIITDRKLFHTYDTSGAVKIGTANCGSLSAIASGDVIFRLPFGDQFVLFTLRHCLHAPDAPINLISVGALNEGQLTVAFIPGKPTSISYPLSDPVLPGFVFYATVIGRLSFLCLDFVLPSQPRSCAFPAITFPKTKMSSTLWHRHFGHLGMDATRETLLKDYATGLHFSGPFVQEHCVACIIGKSPQHSYLHHGHRAMAIGELLHMDLCGPYPVQTPDGKKHFYVILDDHSNFGFLHLLRLKNEAFTAYCHTEAFIRRSCDKQVITVHVDGALELTKGDMAAYFVKQGIVVQKTAPYTHQQAGKIERYVRTIEEGGQTLIADSGLPMSFWGWAVMTSQYLRNRLPTSTLASNITPFQVLTSKKPDLSHLRVWGCQCFPAIPTELRTKAGPRRYEAIFIGYEEARVGWLVRDLMEKVLFSRDVIFNEDLSGRLGIPRTPSSMDSVPPDTVTRLVRDRIRTHAGRDYDNAIRLKQNRASERAQRRKTSLPPVLVATQRMNGGVAETTRMDVGTDGGADVDVTVDENIGTNGGADVGMIVDANVGTNGGADVLVAYQCADTDGMIKGIGDISYSPDALADYISFLAPLSFPVDDDLDIGVSSLVDDESDILWDHICLSPTPISLFLDVDQSCAFKAYSGPHRSFDLSKEPLSYTEAVTRPDADSWRVAMEREKTSLEEMGAFEEVDLPPGERTIGLKWVYAYKTNSEGVNILEKARVVARILLTWAAVQDLEIYQLDCKTAFLHAKIRHPIYARQFPGYALRNSSKVLRILVALYGLRQSAFEFYTLLMSLFLSIGMVRCEVDHGVFFGKWSSSPDPSISMPTNGDQLVLYIPIHVDDGLAITNSLPLYHWFLTTLKKKLLIVDLGECSKFLSILIIRDRPHRRLWLSSHLYVSELLAEWHLSNAKYPPTPFPYKFAIQDQPTALPDISDDDLLTKYQRLVGCLMYLGVSTRPDIAYYAMWLGQFSSKPSRSHMLAAKHVLRYLGGTKLLALSLGLPSPSMPTSLNGFIKSMGCSDADWASDAIDRKSISGYSFFFQGSLVSWSSVKQKSIALSSTEAEYYAMTHAFREALWIRVFLGFLNFPILSPFPILTDNQATCSLSHSPAISARSKHINICHHFICALVQDGSFITTWIPTVDMPADILTKSLGYTLFSKHRAVLGLSIPFS